ncbi:hypothetical protein L1887_14970 [Cichorium endivia]|nr:hypothetical protein L1887_14970 [Cichorium endivia]
MSGRGNVAGRVRGTERDQRIDGWTETNPPLVRNWGVGRQNQRNFNSNWQDMGRNHASQINTHAPTKTFVPRFRGHEYKEVGAKPGDDSNIVDKWIRGEDKSVNDRSNDEDTHVAESDNIENNDKAIEDRGGDNTEENEGNANMLWGDQEQKENQPNDNTSHLINQFDVPKNQNPCLKNHHRSDSLGACFPNNVTGDDSTEGSTSNPGGSDDKDVDSSNKHSDDSIDLNVEPDEGIWKLGEDMIRSQEHPKKYRNKDNKKKKSKAAKNAPASVKFKDVVPAYSSKKSRRSDSLLSNRSNHCSPSKSNPFRLNWG